MDTRDFTPTKRKASRREERKRGEREIGKEERVSPSLLMKGARISWPPLSALRRYERHGKTFRLPFLVNAAEG